VPTATDAARAAAWWALAEGTRAVTATARALLSPAAAAVGYNHPGTRPPAAWRAAESAFRDGTAGIGWGGTHRLVTGPEWSWETSDGDARRAGCASAGTALTPLYQALTRSAHDLVARLLALTLPGRTP
jgi:hypothetical protein